MMLKGFLARSRSAWTGIKAVAFQANCCFCMFLVICNSSAYSDSTAVIACKSHSDVCLPSAELALIWPQ